METVEETALRLVTDFAVYDWNERTGFEQNMRQSKNLAHLVCDEVISQFIDPCETTRFYVAVKNEIEKL